MSLLVGISGKKESGKTTAGKHIEKWGYQTISFAQPIKQICMDYFDLTPEDVYGSQKEVVKDEWMTTPRRIMQFVGTDLFRQKLKELIPNAGDFWINRFKKDYKKVVGELTVTRTHTQVDTGTSLWAECERIVSVGSPDHLKGDRHLSKAQVKLGYKKVNVVVDDVRFENEAQVIRELGGKLIKIKRPNQDQSADNQFGQSPNADRPEDDHVSEQELDDSLFDHIIINDGTLEELEMKIDDLLN